MKQYATNTLTNHNAGGWVFNMNLSARTLLVLFAFLEKNVVRYCVHVMNMLPFVSSLSQYIVPVVYIALIGVCLLEKGFRFSVKPAVICVPLFAVFAIVGTAVLYPENMEHILEPSRFWNTIFPCLRWYIVGLAIIPDKKTMELLGKASCLAVLVETAFVVLYMIPNGIMDGDDMSRSYQLLPNVLLALNYAVNKKKLIPWLFAVIGIFYTLSLGTRGPIVIIFAFLVMKVFLDPTVKKWVKITAIICLALAGVIFSFGTLLVSALESLRGVFKSIGLSTRILDFTINGTLISNTTGRDELFVRAIQLISKRPLFGYGVYGEWQFLNWNAHNIYLEVLIHFGVILGPAILLWAVGQVFKAYYRNPNKYAKDLLLVYISFVFVRGFFGGSWLNLGVFFLLGFCLQESKRKKIALRQNNETISKAEEC